MEQKKQKAENHAENHNEDVQIKDMIGQVRKLVREIPDTCIDELHDPDTILADVVDIASCCETGIAEEVFSVWENSSDKKAVEELFYSLCGITFRDYLEKCIKNTYRTNRKECA